MLTFPTLARAAVRRGVGGALVGNAHVGVEKTAVAGAFRCANSCWGVVSVRCFSAVVNGAGQGPPPARGSDRDGCVVVVTSGKGGVGKTTSAASLAYGLAQAKARYEEEAGERHEKRLGSVTNRIAVRQVFAGAYGGLTSPCAGMSFAFQAGHKTCVIDFDIGLRNMDLHLGCERRVIFDFVNVIQEQCTLNQALIQDRRNPMLSLLAASQTKDKEALTEEGVTRVIRELQNNFAFVVCDSPAGIESGARHAMYLADEAVIVTNPEMSSCRDSDKMVGFIASKSRRAETGDTPVRQTLLVTRYDPERAANDDMLNLKDIQELLGLEVLGLVPESKAVLTAINLGKPVIMEEGDDAAQAYKDAVDRFLGKQVDLRFASPKPAGLLKRIFGR